MNLKGTHCRIQCTDAGANSNPKSRDRLTAREAEENSFHNDHHAQLQLCDVRRCCALLAFQQSFSAVAIRG